MTRPLGCLLALVALAGGIALWLAGADAPGLRVVAGVLGLVVLAALVNGRRAGPRGHPSQDIGEMVRRAEASYNELSGVRDLARTRRETYDPHTDPRVLKSIKRHQDKLAKIAEHQGVAPTGDALVCVRCARTLQRTDSGSETKFVLLVAGQLFGLRCQACARVFCNECLAGKPTPGVAEARNLSLECPECQGHLEVVGAA